MIFKEVIIPVLVWTTYRSWEAQPVVNAKLYNGHTELIPRGVIHFLNGLAEPSIV